MNGFPLFAAHHRADVDAFVFRVAHFHRLLDGGFGNGVYFVQTLGRHQQTGGGGAGLAAVEVGGENGFGNGIGKVGIVQNNVGRFAAQFERNAFHGVGRALGNGFAHAGGAGEADFVNIRVDGELIAHHGAGAVQDIDHAFGNAGCMDAFHHHLGLLGRKLGGLDHHGATGADGRGHFGADKAVAHVPRNNNAHHTCRLQAHFGMACFGLEVEIFHHAGHFFEIINAVGHDHFHKCRSAAVFIHHHINQILLACFERGMQFFQIADALFFAGLRKGFQRFFGGRNGFAGVHFIGQAHIGHFFIAHRAE